jgi:hypothetical protein
LFVDMDLDINMFCFVGSPSIAIGKSPFIVYGLIPLESVIWNLLSWITFSTLNYGIWFVEFQLQILKVIILKYQALDIQVDNFFVI